MQELLTFFAFNFDLPILEWIAQNMTNPLLDTVMPLITLLGDAGIFWILVSVIMLCIPKYRKTGLAMGAALVMGLIVCNLAMKPLIARSRPYDFQFEHFGKAITLLVSTPHDFSFPSGHTLASFEAATALLIGNKKLGIPAMILACLIAFSRLYLYVHYPTDVLFAVVMGIGFGILGTWLVKKGISVYQKKHTR